MVVVLVDGKEGLCSDVCLLGMTCSSAVVVIIELEAPASSCGGEPSLS